MKKKRRTAVVPEFSRQQLRPHARRPVPSHLRGVPVRDGKPWATSAKSGRRGR